MLIVLFCLYSKSQDARVTRAMANQAAASISVTFHVVISGKWHFDTDKCHRALIKFGVDRLGGWKGDGHVLQVVE